MFSSINLFLLENLYKSSLCLFVLKDILFSKFTNTSREEAPVFTSIIMAAVYAPQQAQPSQVAQGGGQSAQEDPLFAALQKYITTGPDATNITTKELQTLYDESLADAASKVYLEKFLIDQPDIPFSSNWQDKTAMSGIIKLTKTSLSFNLTASSVEVSTKGEAPGLNVSSETQVVYATRFQSYTTQD